MQQLSSNGRLKFEAVFERFVHERFVIKVTHVCKYITLHNQSNKKESPTPISRIYFSVTSLRQYSSKNLQHIHFTHANVYGHFLSKKTQPQNLHFRSLSNSFHIVMSCCSKIVFTISTRPYIVIMCIHKYL